MQRWEYKLLYRYRSTKPLKEGSSLHFGTEWANSLDGEDSEEKLSQILANLGQDGWELVGITSNSDLLGAFYNYENQIAAGTGSIHIPSQDYAGFTTSEIWVFKRPQS